MRKELAEKKGAATLKALESCSIQSRLAFLAYLVGRAESQAWMKNDGKPLNFIEEAAYKFAARAKRHATKGADHAE